MSDPEDSAPTDAPSAGVVDAPGGGPDRPAGGTRRVIIAVAIVVLVVAFAAALSITGARDHRRPEVGLPPTPAHTVLALAPA
ncbi:MAG: hypothetical protein ABSC90_01025 [Acidimicrobiales bacterium]